MPIYNGAAHLAQAIASILAQSFRDVELILCDNASTDGTEEICRRYVAADTRVRYHRQPENIGAPRNYNMTFALSRGSYFKWASANDYCDKEFLADCVAVLDQRRDVVVVCPLTRLHYGDTTVDESQGMELAEASACARFKAFLHRIQLNNVFNGLIRADALRRTSLQHKYYGSDVVLMSELSLHGKFAVVPRLHFHRRMDSATASKFFSDAQREQMMDPKRENSLLFQNWREDQGYFAAVWRARPPWGERLCLYRYLTRHVIRNRANLVADVREAGRRLLGAGPLDSR